MDTNINMTMHLSGGVNLLQWNARSIATNLLGFQQFISTNTYSLLALQSLNVDETKMPKLTNYDYPPLCACDTNSKVKSAIYVRQGYDYEKLTLTTLPPNTEDIYLKGVTVKINKNDILNVISVYLPRGPKNDNTDWLKNIDFTKGKWVILGDFNAHAPFWDSGCYTVTSNRLVENIVDSKLTLLNDGSITRVPDVSNHRPSAIDLTLLSPSLAIDCTWSVEEDCLGSDHFPITLSFKELLIPDLIDIEDKIPKYMYKLADWDSFQSYLQFIDPETIEDEDIDIFYSKFLKAIMIAADRSIPKCKHRKSGKRTGNRWWTKDCEDAVNYKKEQYKIWLKDQSEENFVRRKQARNECKKVIAKAKKQFWTEFCINEVSESEDLHKVWKKVNDMKNGFRLPTYPVKLENNRFPSVYEKAEAFVTMFAENSISSQSQTSIKHDKLQEEQHDSVDISAYNTHYLNGPIQLDEYFEVLESFAHNKSAVGPDGITYQMLTHLPSNWKRLLLSFFQKCWINGTLPNIWKQSIVVPILKNGKPRSSLNSYRPIALTSHVGKVLEKIIQRRLLHYCEKNNVIPTNQGGFRKGRCTCDHLVKLTHHIKLQFAKRKSVLATFFDVKKAYDRVCHERLLYKLKSIGISGTLFNYVKSFLSDRSICTKLGAAYSSMKAVNLGIPQGSILAPLLFSVLVHDLPNSLSSTTHVVQYADDIAMWINTSIRKNTKKRVLNYVEKLYQDELDKLSYYMKENKMELSGEKTCLVLFNNGENPKELPVLNLERTVLQYKSYVKFLGVYLTTKLNWKRHIEKLISDARKRLNFLKIISAQAWSQDTKTLLHLAVSLVRSKLIYGQEVYFSAAGYLLKKLQSIDSKAIKIALGVPTHANTLKTYKETHLLPLSDQRKLAVSKYVIRSLAVSNSVRDEIFYNQERDYPKRARTISFLQPIFNYTNELMKNNNIDIADIPILPTVPKIPPWEHLSAKFDTDYTDIRKEENQNLLMTEAKIHLDTHYFHHLKVFTDGSVLESGKSGAAFVIPGLKVQKSFHIGRNYSIFTSELCAILMALNFISNTFIDLYNIVFCVDSKAVLMALQHWHGKIRNDLIFEIKFLIHSITSRGIQIAFCWVPSHSGLYWNEFVDSLAKQGASEHNSDVFTSNFRLSSFELISKLKEHMHSKFLIRRFENITCSRNLDIIILKLRLNAWNTKYSREVTCCCCKHISVHHLLFDCPILEDMYKKKGLDVKKNVQ